MIAKQSHNAVDRARELNERRLKAMVPLLEAATEIDRLTESLVTAQRARDDALASAVKAGWSAQELRELGLSTEAPKRRRKRAPRSVKTSMPATPIDTGPGETTEEGD